MLKNCFVYILTNKTNRVLYVGVTSNLAKRIHEHKDKTNKGFTQKYQIDKLVYCEQYDNIGLAIQREKQIKAGSREKKLRLIESINPGYDDLYPKLFQ